MAMRALVALILAFCGVLSSSLRLGPAAGRATSTISRSVRRLDFALNSVYSSAQGIPAALVEERDACGVGFIASLQNEASHSIVKQALDACTCMEHRGATSSDNISGDGAGVMTDIPWDLFVDFGLKDKKHPAQGGGPLNADGSIASAVAMVFLPRDQRQYEEAREIIVDVMARAGLKIAGWRDVPVDSSVLGALSKDFVPQIRQLVLQATDSVAPSLDAEAFEKKLYDARREVQGYFRTRNSKDAYICSMSSKTIVYKGMLRSCDLPLFYTDLTNPSYKSSFAVYHRRFSTNTVPKWFLAQPMRLLAHNGEINTLLGNINWVKSRQFSTRSPSLLENLDNESADSSPQKRVRAPLVDVGRSDSANLDSVLESYVKNGRSPEEALMIMVPEAYSSQPRLKAQPNVRSFYSYFESMQEAWDGPALLVFSDGTTVGAALDRNGLRPARYMLTADAEGKEMVHVMSEVGVTKQLQQFADASKGEQGQSGLTIIESGRLGPGEMLSVNIKSGQFMLNDEVKQFIAAKRPYEKWAAETVLTLPQQQSNQGEVTSYINKYVQTPELRQAALQVANSDSTAAVAVEGAGGGLDAQAMIEMQTAFGWGSEEVEVQIDSMAKDSIEATFCMGDDAPLAALSVMPHTMYDYFKQRFAQVTNPPIDPLREGAVMSLSMFLGPRGDPLTLEVQQGTRVKIDSPILNSAEIKQLSGMPGVSLSTLSTFYPVTDALAVGGLEEALNKLTLSAIEAVKNGATVINLSDLGEQYYPQSSAYIPPLLAVGTVHHRLIEAGLRTKVSLIVTTGQAWSTHHFACLLGFGASAVNPYAAYEAVINWHSQKRNQNAMEKGDIAKMSAAKAIYNYRKAVDKGLLKILSKMGISLLTSYHGAQIFESLGLADDVLLKAFKGTPSRVSGLTFDDIAAENCDFLRRAFGDAAFTGIAEKVEQSSSSQHTTGAAGEESEVKGKKLFNYGFLNFFKSGEFHHNNQPLIKTLHQAIRTHDLDLYNMYEQAVTSRPPTTLRDTLQFQKFGPTVRKPIPLDQVEPAENILKRFCSGGMSLGALSREAHETLAISMNRIGGKSNSGEGGEDPVRLMPITDVNADTGTSAVFPHLKGLKQGDIPSSKIKQVASGRFGVTPQYLMSAEQLEIKVAQGAKPGEGGQLPGAKIDAYIAGLRKSKPGVTLISPPPHHDIYSIEDLAQLIHDLHQINPAAGVSVKLVSEVGIGTVASGVAKAGADIIQVSGHDGGTGASPASSIKHAGSPWELGLVEVHSTLLANGLRERVLVRVDGGLKSGWDVVMAAAMGAEEFGFGTIAMIAEGCIMARICHTNKCPVGITTQNEKLRLKFPGTPDNVVTFFGYVAEEVRHILAELGYTSLEEIIGRPGVLSYRQDLRLKKTSNLDVSYVLDNLMCKPVPGENFCDTEEEQSKSVRPWLTKGPVFSNGHTLDDTILADAQVMAAINDQKTATKSYQIKNEDRSSFSRISGVLAKKYGDKGFKGLLRFSLTGAAGQSFGAFLGQGMEVTLKGYANDYVGKGMCGGKITVCPPTTDGIRPTTTSASASSSSSSSSKKTSKDNFSMVGNTVLYGATGGSLFVKGRAGERLAVRNSGALCVVEGLGDHGCEYMTAGNIVCLGNTGRNFGAGMTGGLAFIVDDEAWLDKSTSSEPKLALKEFLNPETVSIFALTTAHANAKAFIVDTLKAHIDETDSSRAKFLLEQVTSSNSAVAEAALGKITCVMPASEKVNVLVATVGAPVQASVNVSA